MGWSWAVLGRSWGGPWGVLARSWASRSDLGGLLGDLGAILERLGANLGSLGPILGRLGGILRRSWAPVCVHTCARVRDQEGSWTLLGAQRGATSQRVAAVVMRSGAPPRDFLRKFLRDLRDLQRCSPGTYNTPFCDRGGGSRTPCGRNTAAPSQGCSACGLCLATVVRMWYTIEHAVVRELRDVCDQLGGIWGFLG